MKFNTILRGFINESNALIKIAVKVDPGVGSSKDYRKFDGYEGFILKEIGDGDCEVAIENENFDIAKIPLSCISIIDIPNADVFNIFKNVCLSELDSRNLLTNEKINKLSQCDSLDFLEQYLKEDGLNDADIKDLYKKAIRKTIVGEAVDWKKVGSVARKAAPHILKTAVAPDLVLGDLAQKGIDKLYGKKEEGKDPGNAPPPPASFKPVDAVRPPLITQKDNPFFGIITGDSTRFDYYKNRTGLYVHNKNTGDVFKISVDPTNADNREVRGFNLNSGGTGLTNLEDYIINTLPTEIRSGNPNYRMFRASLIS